MIQNTIDELIKINEDLVQSNKIDSNTYHSILTRLESIKMDAEWKLNTVFSVMTDLKIDVISVPTLEKGTVKIFVNVDNLHNIMSRQFNKLQ